MKISLLVILLIFLVGCSSTMGLDPVIGHSGFDNAKTVNIVPHSNRCGWDMVCTGLGAQWNSSKPHSAILIVRVANEYMAISNAELNIDGKIINLRSVGTVTDFHNPVSGSAMRESKRAFATTVETVKSILSAKRVWLRVSTPTGYLEHPVIDDDGDSKAYHALKRFMRSVRS